MDESGISEKVDKILRTLTDLIEKETAERINKYLEITELKFPEIAGMILQIMLNEMIYRFYEYAPTAEIAKKLIQESLNEVTKNIIEGKK